MRNENSSKNTALIVAGIVFLFVAIMHGIRYMKAWTIMIVDFNVPLNWSIIGGIIAAILAIWMFIAASIGKNRY